MRTYLHRYGHGHAQTVSTVVPSDSHTEYLTLAQDLPDIELSLNNCRLFSWHGLSARRCGCGWLAASLMTWMRTRAHDSRHAMQSSRKRRRCCCPVRRWDRPATCDRTQAEANHDNGNCHLKCAARA